jgi:hypothetical protein
MTAAITEKNTLSCDKCYQVGIAVDNQAFMVVKTLRIIKI